jgi:hypothetical protein
VPLHAGCVGAAGKGVLLMGNSGAGKSTLSLQALANGMQLLSEDSAFVAIESLRVTGVPTYVHVSRQALRFVASARLRKAIANSPTIERRSGIRKLEIDVRQLGGNVAPAPLRLTAVVFLSLRAAGRRPALQPLRREAVFAKLRREQSYACAQPNWRDFERRIVDVPAYELRRLEHPDLAVRLLRTIL